MSRPTVTVIGLGAMGTAVACAFVRSGYPTTVWNRTPDKGPAGAMVAETVPGAISASEVVVVCLLDYEVVDEVLGAVDLDGKAVVNLTTGSPVQARTMAGRLRGNYLTGGIIAVPHTIGTAEAVVLYGGSPDVHTRYYGLLDALGSAKFVGEDPGLPSIYDLAVRVMMSGSRAQESPFDARMAAIAEVIAAGDEAGIDRHRW